MGAHECVCVLCAVWALHDVVVHKNDIVQEFQGPLKSSPIPGQVAAPLPLPRTFPTLTSLLDPELVGQPFCGHDPLLTPKLLLMWGKRNERTISDEVWLLDPLSYVWTKVWVVHSMLPCIHNQHL